MNVSAVKQTDDLFYARHPELVDKKTGKRTPLTLGPKDRNLRREWMQMYRDVDAIDKAGFKACDVKGVIQRCPAAPAPSPAPAAPAPAAPPPPPPPPPKPCKIEVRAFKLSALGYYHLYIIITDVNGKEWYMRGGPEKKSGGYGKIVTMYGEYVPGTIDWQTGAPSVTVMNSPAACGKADKLREQMDLIEATNTPYHPLGPNSNSTVYTALKNVGITPQKPVSWAPGKDDEIKVTPPAPAPAPTP